MYYFLTKLPVSSDCKFDISLNATMYATDPKFDETCLPMTDFDITPKITNLDAWSFDDEGTRPEYHILLSTQVPIPMIGDEPDFKEMKKLVDRGQDTFFLLLSITGGKSYVIPVVYERQIKSLVLQKKSGRETEVLSSISFDELVSLY